MKKIIWILLSLTLTFCDDKLSQKKEFYYKIESKTIDDSTSLVTNWASPTNGMMFTITKKDTISKAIVTKNNDYLNLVYLSKSGKIEKLKLLAKVNNKLKVNEIIYYDNGEINLENSFAYIKTIQLKDSVKLLVPPGKFNRMEVIIGNSVSFDENKWTFTDTLRSEFDHITISNKYMNRYCKLNCILDKSDKNAKGTNKYLGLSYLSIYFDLRNLINRDITKSLLAID